MLVILVCNIQLPLFVFSFNFTELTYHDHCNRQKLAETTDTFANSPYILSGPFFLGTFYPGKECEVCGRQFFAKSTFSHHRAMHRGDTKCPVCLKVFSTRGYMKQHAKESHGVDL